MTRLHRVLLHVVASRGRVMWVSIPSWSIDEHVEVNLGAMPSALHPLVKPDAYFLAMANLAAKNALDLNLQMFEYVEPPLDDTM